MRRIGFAFLLLFAPACSKRFFSVHPPLGQVSTATVGSPLVTWSEGVKKNSNVVLGFKNELIYMGTDQGVVRVGFRETDSGVGKGPAASPRGLRHGFGVAAVSAGIPLTLLQKWRGHAQLSTTAIYTDAAEEIDIAARMWS